MIYDISVPLHPKMIVWPGNAGFRARKSETIGKNGVEVTELGLSTHTGTHIDAPRHFVKGTTGIDRTPLDRCWGPCRVVEVRGSKRDIMPSDVASVDWTSTKRLLFKTSNGKKVLASRFTPNYVSLSLDCAKLLVRKGVEAVGIDYLSIERHDKTTVHKTLLKAGVVIIETLCLADVPAGEYEMVAMPLKLKGLDGSPTRVVLKS